MDVYKPNISVVICTYNRGEVFRDTLSSFAGMDIPEPDVAELLLVDNRSTDATKEIAHRFIAEGAVPTRYIYEPRQGLSHARNCGIENSRGNLVAFVDDDVYFDRGWLTAVLQAFAGQPEAAALGGRSTPLFAGGRPSWMIDRFLTLYGDTRFGEQSRWLTFPEHPFGLNMAFRKEVLDDVGRFDPDLGRKKRNLLSNEENELFERIASSGRKVYYCAEALLRHRIPESRVDPGWILERYYWQGISEQVQSRRYDPQSKSDLFMDAVKETWRSLRTLTGGHLSPRKIRWHYRGIALPNKAWNYYRLGKARQKLLQAIGH
jgi:glycosyltransferase involved in cell wall biosynthesis